MEKTAILFAGQGAQFVGMGRDLAEAFPAAREVFEAADRVLGLGISNLCFEGPQADLNSTENAQPAVLAVGLACLRALEERSRLPEAVAVAGLSLGEYGAHVAAGTIGAEDALRLVRRRGELMQAASEAHPGGMACVLGLEREAVDAACRDASSAGLVAVANLNSPGQVVISGEHEAVARAGEIAKERGAKRVIPLKVSGAFHTPLMQVAADGLAEALAKVEIRAGRIPVIANATADEVREPEDTRRTLLEQLTGTVLFEDSIRKLVADGVTRFIELGPGKVLSGLVRRIAREAETVSLGTAEALAAFEG
ncbi:MAG: ACP S-malonyltransferase [Planctomycetota bacterium]|jgi:[acyl-carrier-protein] S-malonyltransferase